MKFANVMKTDDWKKEKHVPVIDCQDKVKQGETLAVEISVGKEIAHPNTTEHHIRWIKLYFMPVDGKVVEVNEALSDEPEKINQDANNTWIMAVELENSIESYELMSESEYITMYEKEA